MRVEKNGRVNAKRSELYDKPFPLEKSYLELAIYLKSKLKVMKIDGHFILISYNRKSFFSSSLF